MRFMVRLQLLICLMVYASSAHAIMVKFGTKDGPIVPPAPEPSLPPPQPYRIPAPVWEERSNDTPDPNAQWRPPLFIPQPRYTSIDYNSPASTPQPLNNAQRFVNAYIPVQHPVYPQPSFLSSQRLPGLGLRYFVPEYVKKPQNEQHHKQEDVKLNHIESNDIVVTGNDSIDDVQWKYEKDATRRIIRSSQVGTGVPVYQWPVYVPLQHH